MLAPEFVNRIIEKLELKKPCQAGYEQIGMKMKDGKKVPNCVPIEAKEDLASHKVELNLQGVIQKFVDEVYDEIEYSAKINSAMDQAWVKARNAIQDLAKATQEVKDHLSALDVTSDAKNIQDRVKSAASELGVNPSAVKGYDDIAGAVQDAKRQAQESRANIKDSKVPKA